MIKSPVDVTIDGLKWGGEKVGEWAFELTKDYLGDLATEYISLIPIMAGVSIATYAFFNMVSNSLARMSVVGVFAYGGLVVISS